MSAIVDELEDNASSGTTDSSNNRRLIPKHETSMNSSHSVKVSPKNTEKHRYEQSSFKRLTINEGVPYTYSAGFTHENISNDSSTSTTDISGSTELQLISNGTGRHAGTGPSSSSINNQLLPKKITVQQEATNLPALLSVKQEPTLNYSMAKAGEHEDSNPLRSHKASADRYDGPAAASTELSNRENKVPLWGNRKTIITETGDPVQNRERFAEHLQMGSCQAIMGTQNNGPASVDSSNSSTTFVETGIHNVSKARRNGKGSISSLDMSQLRQLEDSEEMPGNSQSSVLSSEIMARGLSRSSIARPRASLSDDETFTRSNSATSTTTRSQSSFVHNNTWRRHQGNNLTSYAQSTSRRNYDSSVGQRNIAEAIEMRGEIAGKMNMKGLTPCQMYLLELCRALMLYGAPTHRLEECLYKSAGILDCQAQFLYIPDCMIISFEAVDSQTRNTHIVRAEQGLKLGKLCDTHEVYKNVVHDNLSVNDAIIMLNEIKCQKPNVPQWFLLLIYGVASASVGPFAFQAQVSDMFMCFILGLLLGILKIYVVPQSDSFAKICEITVAIITSFCSRAIGSIRKGNMFCFSALAQSSIALILPGYAILCSSLELQSKSIIAGSARLVAAIIYSLFLGYGITIGTVMYGAIQKDATSETTCRSPMPEYSNFICVPIFTACLVFIHEGKLKQVPVMMIISCAGYSVNYFTHLSINKDIQLHSTLGAFTVGLLANLYSRFWNVRDNLANSIWYNIRLLWSSLTKTKRPRNYNNQSRESRPTAQGRRVAYNLAAAAMMPAVFVQVPSGLSASGSLMSGLGVANEIIHNSPNITSAPAENVSSVAMTFTFNVVRVAVGITVGLSFSAYLVYPRRKRRGGSFSF